MVCTRDRTTLPATSPLWGCLGPVGVHNYECIIINKL